MLAIPNFKKFNFVKFFFKNVYEAACQIDYNDIFRMAIKTNCVFLKMVKLVSH